MYIFFILNYILKSFYYFNVTFNVTMLFNVIHYRINLY